MRTFVLRTVDIRSRAAEFVARLPIDGELLEVVVRKHEPRRTLDQNKKLWAMLNDVARQVEWHGQKLAPEDWKDMASAALKRQRVVPAMDGGGFVVLGQRTSKMSKAEMADLIECLYAFGAEHGVQWTEPKDEE